MMLTRPASPFFGSLFLFIVSSLCFPQTKLPFISTNQNHVPAGTLKDGVLTVAFEVAKGEWHPEADDGMALQVYAFGEVGHALQNPGPLIRVPEGTEVHVSIHNTLSVPVTVHGLGASVSAVRVLPERTEETAFKAETAGVYFYWGTTEVEDIKLRYGIDSELTGAIVVDPAGAETQGDEIFVMEMMSEVPGVGARKTLATINGKSWPYTQKFVYELGKQVRWRWINATNEPHALHLHGFFYNIDSFNRGGKIEKYAPGAGPLAVTQRIAQGETFDMSWSPSRAGQWLFHCHMIQHMMPPVVPPVPGLAIRQAPSKDEHASAHGDHSGMGQLVLGIVVPPTQSSPSTEWHSERKLRLEINERPGAPRYALQVREGSVTSGPPGLLGPPIVLTRGQPVEIEIANNLKDPTAIHWHGIELESYYDGVPGWSGSDKQVTPPIAPGTSFVARMIPPRAGTFIYHTHWHDEFQLTNGIYGPLIILPPGETFDPKSDLPFVFSIGNFGSLGEIALINGTPQSKPLPLQAGKKYRLRFINISTNNQGMQVWLRNSGAPVEWKVIAKDGADMPLTLVRPSKAQLTVTVGETYDVEFTQEKPADLLLDLFLPGQKIHTTQTLTFSEPSHSD